LRAFLSEAIFWKPRDCFGKKRLAMTHLLIRNEYNCSPQHQEQLHDVDESFHGIVRTPGVCGGAPRIVRTRIPVWGLVQAQRSGASDADLLLWYPTLRAADLANTWAYFQANQEEIEQQIRQNEEA
jgi:uncharacterized protein (DUF433 family)